MALSQWNCGWFGWFILVQSSAAKSEDNSTKRLSRLLCGEALFDDSCALWSHRFRLALCIVLSFWRAICALKNAIYILWVDQINDLWSSSVPGSISVPGSPAALFSIVAPGWLHLLWLWLSRCVLVFLAQIISQPSSEKPGECEKFSTEHLSVFSL